jgi:hypothetical protein
MQLMVHGHFYQPSREDPFTGRVPLEESAAPYHDWNERITAECYGPNAALGNFGRVSFDLGPTIAGWLARNRRQTYRSAVLQEHGNGMAQAYNHSILPLAPRRDKRTQVRWGIADFERRYGRSPLGMWLPETAADLETLDVLAENGIEFTMLAPWQAASAELDTTYAYRVQTGQRKAITVFFFDAWLSGSVSFDPWATEDARRFVDVKLAERRVSSASPEQFLLIASDGELYGHHQRGREHWLHELLSYEAPRKGYSPTFPEVYLDRYLPEDDAEIREQTSWSCHHGVARWSTGCECTPGDSSWKLALRAAFDRFGRALDAACEDRAAGILTDFWAARDDYIHVRLGEDPLAFVRKHAAQSLSSADELAMLRLLEAQYCGQAMQVSDAYYWEELTRLEPRTAIAYACRAALLVREAGAADVEGPLRCDLSAASSAQSGVTAMQLYDEARERWAEASEREAD